MKHLEEGKGSKINWNKNIVEPNSFNMKSGVTIKNILNIDEIFDANTDANEILKGNRITTRKIINKQPNNRVSAIHKYLYREFNEDINFNKLDECEEANIAAPTNLLCSTIDTKEVKITKDNRIDNVQRKIISIGKVCFQNSELLNQLINSENEIQQRLTLLESNEIKDNFTMIEKENIEEDKTGKINEIFNEDNVDSHNIMHIEDSPNNRKFVNETSTVRVSIKNTNKNGEKELRQDTASNYSKKNKMIIIYTLKNVFRSKVETQD